MKVQFINKNFKEIRPDEIDGSWFICIAEQSKGLPYFEFLVVNISLSSENQFIAKFNNLDKAEQYVQQSILSESKDKNLNKVKELIILGIEATTTGFRNNSELTRLLCDDEMYYRFKLEGISILKKLLGIEYPLYEEFARNVENNDVCNVEKCLPILNALKVSIVNDEIM